MRKFKTLCSIMSQPESIFLSYGEEILIIQTVDVQSWPKLTVWFLVYLIWNVLYLKKCLTGFAKTYFLSHYPCHFLHLRHLIESLHPSSLQQGLIHIHLFNFRIYFRLHSHLSMFNSAASTLRIPWNIEYY